MLNAASRRAHAVRDGSTVFTGVTPSARSRCATQFEHDMSEALAMPTAPTKQCMSGGEPAVSCRTIVQSRSAPT